MSRLYVTIHTDSCSDSLLGLVQAVGMEYRISDFEIHLDTFTATMKFLAHSPTIEGIEVIRDRITNFVNSSNTDKTFADCEIILTTAFE